MIDIRKEFEKMSKQGKFNLHFYLIHVMAIVIMFCLGITVLTLDKVISNQETKIEQLQDKVTRLEQIQNNLITHINSVGG